MNIKLLNDWLLIEAPVEKDAGGLFIPKAMSDSDTEGVVAFVPDDPIGVAVGDKIRWEKFAEAEGKVKLDGKEYYMIKKQQIIFAVKAGK